MSGSAPQFRCFDCKMSFNSSALLQKHRTKFCVGSSLGDSRGLRGPLRQTSPQPPQQASDSNGTTHPRLEQHQLALSYDRQMALLHQRSAKLNQQKQDIEQRLVHLSQRDFNPTTNEMSQLLLDLKEQEARNTEALERMKQQIEHLKTTKKQNPFNYLSDGTSLVADIGAMRQAYLQSGGSDPAVLQQMAQLLAEAQVLERRTEGATERKAKGTSRLEYMSEQLFNIELENARIQRELAALHYHNTPPHARRQRHAYDAGPYRSQLEAGGGLNSSSGWGLAA